MKAPLLTGVLTLLLACCCSADDDAWQAWQKGNIDQAVQLAPQLEDRASRDHLLLLCSVVSGRYESAIERYAKIPETYARYRELDRPLIDCYLHLGRYDEAVSFAEARGGHHLESLRMRADRPLRATLEELAVVPFAEHELGEYFPAFAATLEGNPVTVHIDTGGSFLSMSPDHAKKYGIETIDYGQGYHGHRKVKLQFGIAGKFVLGGATLENVPVIVSPTIKRVIIGTCVLKQFLSTLDYPRQRLILSPLDDSVARDQHLSMLPQHRAEVPFHMWGDHYMFARGFVGDDDQLNFFMDSGLVALRKINDDPMIQAGFMSSKEKYFGWGFVEDDWSGGGFFRSDLPIGIGPLKQEGLWFLAGPGGEASGKRMFGGVQMHGLLAHAFVKRYSWTIDFDRRRYIFGGVE